MEKEYTALIYLSLSGMKKYILCILWLLLLGWISVAQEQEAEVVVDDVCNEYFSINGPEAVYLWETLNYSLGPNIDQGLLFPVLYSLRLSNGEKVIQSSQDRALQVSFGEEGVFSLQAEIQQADCTYSLEKTIKSYQKSLVYLGEVEDSFQLGFDQNFAEQGVYFSTIFLDKSPSEEEIRTILRKEIRNLSFADIILIKSNAFDQVLNAYIELLEQGILEGDAQRLYVISNSNQSFLKRVLSVFVPDLGNNQIATVKSSDFLNFLTAFSLQKWEEEINAFASFHSLQQERGSRYLVLSYLVDQAINNGISLQILGTLLVMSLVVLVISGLRQVGGLSVFGVYQPLLFAIALFLIGWKAALFLFVIATITTASIRIFGKYVLLLQSAKISLLICLYSILLLFGFWIDHALGLGIIGKLLRSNGFIILPIIIVVMAAEKIYTEHFKITKKSGRVALAEFAVITLLSRWMLESQVLRTFMLSYPELLFAVGILIIIVGRFTGLQLFELLRFMPLIRRHLEEEEEEE